MVYFTIILTILGIIWKVFIKTLGLGAKIVRYFRIKRLNYKNRGVRNRHRLNELELLDGVHWHHNLMVTGESDAGRRLVLAQLAAQINLEGVPVVILHRGNRELEREILNLHAPNTVICNRGNRRYDPLQDHDPSYIPDLILENESAAKRNLNAASREYTRAIAEMYALGARMSTSVTLLESCTDTGGNPPMGFAELIKRVDQLQQRGSLQQGQAAGIKALLKANQMENTNVHNYLTQLMTQLSSCTAQKNERMPASQQISLFRNAASRGILCLDISSVSTNCEMAFSAIFNEFMDTGMGSYYVIMDNVEIGESPTLSRWLSRKSFHYCISCNSIQDILPQNTSGADSAQSFFTRLADGCQMQILFKQPPKAADMWSAYYVTYKRLETAFAFGKEKIVQVSSKDERTMLASQLSKDMGTANLFVYETLNGSDQYYTSVLRPHTP